MHILERWEARRTERWFSDTPIEEEKIKILCNIIPCIPAQQGEADHFWFCISRKEIRLRTFISVNVFQNNNEDGNFGFGSVYSAPFMFLSCDNQASSCNNSCLNIGLHTGVLLSVALELGLDVATIGCTAGFNTDKVSEFNTLIRQCRSIPGAKELYPVTAVCVGYKDRKYANRNYIQIHGKYVATQLSKPYRRKPNNFIGK